MEEPKKCPFCGGKTGYYMYERVHRGLYFTWDGREDGASEDISDWESKRAYCSDCNRILPRKMVEK